MNEFKLLFLDVDGTLITPDDTIEDSTKEAITQVQRKGVEVFLATGRPLHELNALSSELNIRSFIGYNGAYAIYQGEDIFQEPIEGSIVKDFMEIVSNQKHDAVLYTNSHNAFTKLGTPLIEDFINVFHFHKNKLYSPALDENILGMTLINLNEEDIGLYQQGNGIHLSQVNIDGMRHCYDVIRDKVNKGYGIQMVLEMLGISKEMAIAFGDGMNDKEMLQQVGESFAMANGHPDLFKFAKHKTTEVTNSGIYNGLKKLGLV